MGAAAWEAARIQDGRPVAGKELTEQHLPLDAGLYHAVSLNKGCYMGQETLAKVHKLNAVKQQLHGLVLDAQVPPGTLLLSGEHQVLFRVVGWREGRGNQVLRGASRCCGTCVPQESPVRSCFALHDLLFVLLQSMITGFHIRLQISATLNFEHRIDTNLWTIFWIYAHTNTPVCASDENTCLLCQSFDLGCLL